MAARFCRAMPGTAVGHDDDVVTVCGLVCGGAVPTKTNPPAPERLHRFGGRSSGHELPRRRRRRLVDGTTPLPVSGLIWSAISRR
jgi:hypothetical protein